MKNIAINKKLIILLFVVGITAFAFNAKIILTKLQVTNKREVVAKPNFTKKEQKKTATNTTDKSYIFDQFYQTNPCGWSVALQDGKIVFNAQSNLSVNSIYSYGQIAELISTNIYFL